MTLTLRRLWIQLTADRKRFGVLCAMLTVGLLLWARVIVVSNIPRTAAAEDGEAEETEAVERNVRSIAAHIDRVTRQAVEVRLDEAPRRDPFVINPDYFPNSPFDGQRSHEEAKSDRKRDEDDDALHSRQRQQRVIQQAELLKLEAVMTGAELAVISGRTYRLGDEVPGQTDESIRFELVEVKQRSVVLKSEVHDFELALPTPK